MENNLKNFFIDYKKRQILNSGELYMFDTKLSKTEHEKINSQFNQLFEKKAEDMQIQPPKKVIDETMFESDDLVKIINLKLKSK